MTLPTDDQKKHAAAWFESLRDDLCAALEDLEDAFAGAGEAGAPGSFKINGDPVETQARLTLSGADVVRLELPGGGGYGRP